jgi:hypothetical protein
MEEQSEQDEDDAGLDTEALRQKLSAAPKYGANARLLLLNAARALAAEEEARGIQPGKGDNRNWGTASTHNSMT